MLLARAVLVLACAAALNADLFHGHCTTKSIGRIKLYPDIDLTPVFIKAGVQNATTAIPDVCSRAGSKTVVIGEEIAVCDEDIAPDFELPPNGAFSPIKVIRRGNLASEASINVNQYCGKRS